MRLPVGIGHIEAPSDGMGGEEEKSQGQRRANERRGEVRRLLRSKEIAELATKFPKDIAGIHEFISL
jgi:hypothetical protein